MSAAERPKPAEERGAVESEFSVMRERSNSAMAFFDAIAGNPLRIFEHFYNSSIEIDSHPLSTQKSLRDMRLHLTANVQTRDASARNAASGAAPALQSKIARCLSADGTWSARRLTAGIALRLPIQAGAGRALSTWLCRARPAVPSKLSSHKMQYGVARDLHDHQGDPANHAKGQSRDQVVRRCAPGDSRTPRQPDSRTGRRRRWMLSNRPA